DGDPQLISRGHRHCGLPQLRADPANGFPWSIDGGLMTIPPQNVTLAVFEQIETTVAQTTQTKPHLQQLEQPGETAVAPSLLGSAARPQAWWRSSSLRVAAPKIPSRRRLVNPHHDLSLLHNQEDVD